MSTAYVRQLAEFYNEGGRKAHDQDGVTQPVVAFHGDRHVVVFLAPMGDIHPTDRIGQIVVALTCVAKPRYIVTVTEGWARVWDAEAEGMPPELNRGDLQRMSETDPKVKTVIMTQVMDIKVPRESYFMTAITEGDPRDKQWKVDHYAVTDGQMNFAGYLPETVLSAAAASSNHPLKDMPLEWHLLALKALDFIDDVLLLSEGAPGAPAN